MANVNHTRRTASLCTAWSASMSRILRLITRAATLVTALLISA
jgi:hypothetical protein